MAIMIEAVSWDRPFAEPVELPKGKKLVTLRDAALYITRLPKAEHDAEEWQAFLHCHIRRFTMPVDLVLAAAAR
jgi:hypothetical protein